MNKAVKNVKVSLNKFIDMFENFKKEISFSGVTFAYIHYFVDEHGSKTINGEKVLQKHVARVITLGASYEDKVNRILENKEEKDGNFKSQAMNGKEYYIDGNRMTCRNIKTGEKMLCLIGETFSRPKTTYFHKGSKMKHAEVRTLEFFTPAGLNPKKADMGGIKEEHKFSFNTLYFRNILCLTVNKTRYIIEN